jgi:hypothetical protein
MNVIKYSCAIVLAFVVLYACKKDDDGSGGDITVVPPEDRGEQQIKDDAALQDYLRTHFYNYESFETPPDDFDYRIVIDTIAGDNSDKVPLKDQVIVKTVNFFEVDYKLYILKVQEGVGEKATIADSTAITYKGQLLNGNVFDSAVTPVYFDLPGVISSSGQLNNTIEGFRQGLVGFGGASDIEISSDGSFVFSNDHGVGALFIPSGLGYFSRGPGNNSYEPLIFTLRVIQINKTDHDHDFLSSIDEDLNGNDNLYDDDTDEDGIPNYLDDDDDRDGTLTKDEITINDSNNDGIITLDEITFYDDDGDGIKNHLDADDRDMKNE